MGRCAAIGWRYRGGLSWMLKGRLRRRNDFETGGCGLVRVPAGCKLADVQEEQAGEEDQHQNAGQKQQEL